MFGTRDEGTGMDLVELEPRVASYGGLPGCPGLGLSHALGPVDDDGSVLIVYRLFQAMGHPFVSSVTTLVRTCQELPELPSLQSYGEGTSIGSCTTASAVRCDLNSQQLTSQKPHEPTSSACPAWAAPPHQRLPEGQSSQ